ncbi:hypothetical protein HC031_04330 [Planosporangium thailandense]|uniref:Lipoprotein n=1 Tax=Planosporangium thailandense TaxID=765197 RepID=A0ABX0XSG7_9ACTN|nr:hypothetical protein [Planosporangium thailandense]NJC68957.1 hypothetical protein [Planosporangium thailandense]
MNGAKTRVGLALSIVGIAATVTGCGRVEPLPPPRSPHVVAPSDSGSPSDDTSAAPDDPAAATAEPADPTPTAELAGQTPGARPGALPGALPGAIASRCADRSTDTQVVAALRRDRKLLLPAGSTPTITTGPLCAGSWQYTVLSVPGRDAIQVVTRGDPGRLAVVTAGTYVCEPEVVSAAPSGILTAAHCR